MFALPDHLGRDAARPLRVVCLGAHADDIEIGAGGTLLRLTAERPHVRVQWIVLSGGETDREAEARASAAAFLASAEHAGVEVHTLRDGLFPQDAEALRALLRARRDAEPADLVLTHRLDDAHQDHRAVAQATWQTFRGTPQIAAYEIPKWDGDLGRPNAYVALDDATAARKAELLGRHFPSQAGKPWFDTETFLGLMRVRGVEAQARYAEAFDCPKLVWR
ncbi:MAG TPA: PIG-L family deacetylase [Rubricoccaceae bacterium]